MPHNGWRYEKLPIARDFLSSYTKVEAGYNPWTTYCPGNFLYRVCALHLFLEGASPLQACWRSLLASDKLVYREVCSEGDGAENTARYGVSMEQNSNGRMGGCSKSYLLCWACRSIVTTITLSRLVRRGYESMLDYYQGLESSIHAHSLFSFA